MKWYKPVYFSENISQKKDVILKKIETNVLQPDIFLIVLANNGKDNFRIISSQILLQKNFRKDDLFIIGVAGGKDESFSLVAKIIDDLLEKGIDIDYIRDYFLKHGAC